MVEAVFHLFQVQGKVRPANPTILVETMLGKGPEAFDAVDVRVVSPAPPPECPVVSHGKVLAETFEGAVTAEGIGEVY